MKVILAILLIAFAMHSDAGAWTHGVGQVSGDQLVTGANDPLTTGGGDPLVTQ